MIRPLTQVLPLMVHLLVSIMLVFKPKEIGMFIRINGYHQLGTELPQHPEHPQRGQRSDPE